MEEGTIYAGFWVRVGATLIDAILITFVTMPILVAVYGWGYYDTDELVFIHGPLDFIVSWVLPAVAIILFWVYRQATPGKMAISARIVDEKTGGKPTTGQFIGRYFAYILSTLPAGLGYIWVAFDRKKRGWHDLLAGTVVIRQRGQEPVRFEGEERAGD